MSYRDCIIGVARAAGRELSDDEIRAVYERVHKAALDINAGRVEVDQIGMGTKGQLAGELQGQGDSIIQRAAELAAKELEAEAALRERQAHLQIVALGARASDFERLKADGIKDLEAVELLIHRDYSGRVNIQSLEQRQAGMKGYFSSKLLKTWAALGSDWLGFFQDKKKLVTLVRELRGENTGDAVAKAGAKAFHETAEEARRAFNAAGGDVGRLDDWGMPQHHSQERVAAAGRDAWTDAILPMLDRGRYVDEITGRPWDDARMREFLGKAWDTIATNGIANLKPGKFSGSGKRANRHAESRQIHYKDAQSVIDYWDVFGDKTALEILDSHIGTMARDVAFVELFGPNPDVTYQTLRDTALRDAAIAEPTKTPEIEGKAVALDSLYEYAAGRMKPTYNRTVSQTADAIANLNVAGKLGGAMIASLYGDKAMMEAVSHMNDLPFFQRQITELSLLNPVNTADRRLLQQQGLMLDSVRSGLQRFYEGLGQSSTTGRIANAVMRITGMVAINDIRKGAFGLNAMAAIGDQIAKGVAFDKLPDSDIRLLRNWGITDADWRTWALAAPTKMVGVENVLTPEAIGRVTDDQLRAAGIISQAGPASEAAAARRNAIVKLLGAVNTESEFAIVTPGWKERATFYGDLQRGTVKGEIARSALQFKAFPWAFLQRGMDAVANMDGATSKAAMVSYLIASTTIMGAMIMQTREMLAGKDPRDMSGKDFNSMKDLLKFWGAAFLQGGALGIYGDFLYGANQTRYGSGPVEALAGPTLGPLLELGIVQPLTAAKKAIEGKDTHLAAQTMQDLKGFVPGGNIWYTKAALDHMIWQRVFEQLSPGYLATIRQRTMKDYGQDWWWRPGETSPERAPDLGKAIAQ